MARPRSALALALPQMLMHTYAHLGEACFLSGGPRWRTSGWGLAKAIEHNMCLAEVIAIMRH